MSISLRLPVAVLLLATTAACVNTERDIATSRDPRAEFTPPRGRGERVSGATVLNTVRATHAFSDPKAPDTFVLQLRGARVLSSQAHLLVLSSRGDTLRQEVLPATALLDDPTLRENQSASVRDKEISILRGMNNFFSDKHFTRLTLPATAAPPADVSPQAWASLRTDPAAVVFDYASPTGEHQLVYARALGKVLVVKGEE